MAPTRPPPGPLSPGFGAFGDGGVWQHTVESPFEPNPASSNVMTSMPPALYAGDARIFGTHDFRNASADTSPPGRPSLHGASWPSSQTLGVMYTRFGVDAAVARAGGGASGPASFVLHRGGTLFAGEEAPGLCPLAALAGA